MTDIVSADGFTRDQVELIKRTVAAGASDDELKMFLYQARRTGLDPFARQIHFTKRGDRSTIIVGIDGYRLIAERTGVYAGNDEPTYEIDENGKPTLARVTVWKLVSGQRCPFSAAARWDEYAPKAQGWSMWPKMPFLMLGKVAEALALRKAFPADLSGIYTEEEMAQADNEPKPSTIVTVTPHVEAPKPTNGNAKPAEVAAPARRSPYICSDCGQSIQPTRTPSGKDLSAKAIAEKTIEMHHRQLCYPCWGKANSAKRAAELAAASQELPMADDDVDEGQMVEA